MITPPRIFQSMIQSNFGSSKHPNFEAVFVEGDSLVHRWRDNREAIAPNYFPWFVGGTVVAGGVAWPGSIIQSSFGNEGNFEVVVPIRKAERTELWHFFHNNDDLASDWRPVSRVTAETDDVMGAPALIQSNMGAGNNGNFEVVVPIRKAERTELWHYFRDHAEAPPRWRAGRRVTRPNDDVSWGGSLIQSNMGAEGNFEVVVPLHQADGRVELWHFFLDTSAPGRDWQAGGRISPNATGPGVIIQSDFGAKDHGNFEVLAPEGNRLVHYWLDNTTPGGQWRVGGIVSESLRGWAGGLLQSTFGLGDHKNFEALAEEGGSSVVGYWRSNSEDGLPWMVNKVLITRGYGHRLPNARKIAQLTGERDRSRRNPHGSETGWEGPTAEHRDPPYTMNRTESRFHIRGTDLGASFRHTVQLDGRIEDRTYFLFGDTWRVEQSEAETNLDAIAFTTDTDPSDGLHLTFLDAPGEHRPPRIIPPVPQREFNVPLDGLSRNGAMLVFFSTDARRVEQDPDNPDEASGQALMGRSILTRSTDNGHTFQQLYTLSRSKFINVSIEQVTLEEDEASRLGLPSRNVVCLWGSGRFRSSDVYLAMLPLEEFETRTGLIFYSGRNGTFEWSRQENDATPLVGDGTVGELSVRWNPFLKRFLLLFASQNPEAIFSYAAQKPWGPWSRVPVTVFDPNPRDPCRGDGFGAFMHVGWLRCDGDLMDDKILPGGNLSGAAYAPYQIAHMATGAQDQSTRLFFTMSTGNPYQVVLMRVDAKAEDFESPEKMASLWMAQSSALSFDNRHEEAIARARSAIEVLRAGLPASGQEAEFSRLLAEALTNLAFRLIEARRVDDAVAPAEEASRAFRHAASMPGANVLAIVDMLWSLASNFVTRPHAAVTPSRVAVDVLRGTAHLMKLAVAWHNFVLRLIEAQRIDEAMAPAQQAVRVYRQAAAIAGANLFEIVDMLASLSAFLLNVAIRPAEAVGPAQASTEILQAATPPGGGDTAFRAKSAQAWHLFAVRLIGANRTGEALPPARRSLEFYRRLAAEDPAFQDELAMVEQLVASLL